MSLQWQIPEGERLALDQAAAAKYGYRNLRYHGGDIERRLLETRLNRTWQHSRPWSVFLAAMGYHWSPGSYQSVLEMVDYTNRQGIYVAMEEIMDRCQNPYDALGAMRNEALMRARQGFEYLLYVDNDVLPGKDYLLRLLRWQAPIVAPYVLEPGTQKPLHGPHYKPNTGLQPVRWCVLSMLLCKVSVFAPWPGGEFWNNAVGADEGYHFQKLWDVGHHPMLDTDTSLEVVKPPTYPLATNRWEEAEAKSFWDKRREWLNEMPDRDPLQIEAPKGTIGREVIWI